MTRRGGGGEQMVKRRRAKSDYASSSIGVGPLLLLTCVTHSLCPSLPVARVPKQYITFQRMQLALYVYSYVW